MNGLACPFCRVPINEAVESAGNFIACPSCHNYFEAPRAAAPMPARAAPPVRYPVAAGMWPQAGSGAQPVGAVPPVAYGPGAAPMNAPPTTKLDFSTQPGSARQVGHTSVAKRYKKKLSQGTLFGLGGGGLLILFIVFRVIAAMVRLAAEN
jgi:hypothetical protein